MPNRRVFCRNAAGAAAGMFIAGNGLAGVAAHAFQAGAVPARRTIMVGGRRMKVVDVHAHTVVPEVFEIVKDTKFASSVAAAPAPTAIAGPERLKAMDQRGTDTEVLSINVYWWYAADRDLAGKIVRTQDEKLAAWSASSQGRFVALSSVAMQFPDLAAEQLDYAVKTLGLKGASIAGHVNGEDLSNPKFDPFWAKVQELGVVVFMHPIDGGNLVKDGTWKGRGDLGNIIGNPLETTFFLSRLIFDGTLDRFPGVRIVASHAGGYLPSYLGRTEVACAVRPAANCANKKKPSEYLKREILVDTLINSDEGLRHLVAEVGAEQIVYGTDIPFNWPDMVDTILKAPYLTDAQREAMLGGTLTRMLHIA